ncbi:MAG: Holliday junction resolvase RuvX [Paracoccaceae bacterium]
MADLFENLNDFFLCLKPYQAILGLDLGTKTIGVSVSDTLLTVATPLKTITKIKFRDDSTKIQEIINDRSISGVVLGLPKNMNGTEGPRAQATRSFSHNLSKVIEVPITYWDERLSTVAAEKALLEADTTRKRRAEVIDSVAAAYILQGALDRFNNIRSKNGG